MVYNEALFSCRHLQVLQVRAQRKCSALEASCRENENEHWQKMAKLEEKNKVLIKSSTLLNASILNI